MLISLQFDEFFERKSFQILNNFRADLRIFTKPSYLKLIGTHCSLHFEMYFIISSDHSVQFQSLRRNVIELLHLLESKNFAKTRNPNLKVNFITSCSNSCDSRYTHEKPFIQESPTVLFSNFRSLFRDDKFTVFEFEGLSRESTLPLATQ